METAYDTVLTQIKSLQYTKQPVLIAIDGRCAAGKTTLAAHLQEELDCNVIHMDHFFLRPEQRTQDRLRKPGGKVDHERIVLEVLQPLRQGNDFSYRPYDCHRQAFGEAIMIKTNSITIAEGSYSCHPLLRDSYDLRIFLTVEPDEQIRRIRQRNGQAEAERFRNVWIPLEEHYFSACEVPEHCDLVINEGVM